MAFLVRACTDPITNITGPIYHLVRGDRDRAEETQKLLLATFRTATVAAFFFLIIPFNRIFGHHDNLSGSFAFTAQFLIHPYAAALFNAFINGGYPIVMKVIDIFATRQLILTRTDAGGFVCAIAFCYLAKVLTTHVAAADCNFINSLDRKYSEWSNGIANWLYK